MLDTPHQVLAKIASRAKARRLALNFTQQTLAQAIVENLMLNGSTIRLDGAMRMAAK